MRMMRYLVEWRHLRDHGVPFIDPRDMSSDELAAYGLTPNDRVKILAWEQAIDPGASLLGPEDLAPVTDVYVKWLMAGANNRPHQLDLVYTFFQHCYHLKDWIKNDPAAPPSLAQTVEQYVTNTPSLSLAADLCNATKHLALTRLRSGAVPQIGGFELTNRRVGGRRVVCLTGVVISHNGDALDAFKVAEQCALAWHRFLQER